MKIQKDGQEQPFIEWRHGKTKAVKRAWVQDRSGATTDWAGSGRYLNIGNFIDGKPIGIPQDFPLHSDISDDHALFAAVTILAMVGGVQL